MSSEISTHDKVVLKIEELTSGHYNVLSNRMGEKHFIGQIFPDIILSDKVTNKPLFIIEVRNNGNIAQCIQQWKLATSIPATLYIVVPEEELQTAKTVAEVVGLQMKFGFYKATETEYTVTFL